MTTKAKAKSAKTPKTGTGLQRMKANLGVAKTEALRQDVLSDQAKAQSEAVGPPSVPATNKAKAKEAKADSRKITVLADSNPHAAGSRRAGWFKQLKTGMTVEDVTKLGVRAIYLKRMAAKAIIKLSQ